MRASLALHIQRALANGMPVDVFDVDTNQDYGVATIDVNAVGIGMITLHRKDDPASAPTTVTIAPYKNVREDSAASINPAAPERHTYGTDL